MINTASVNDILTRIQAAAKEAGVNLTFTNSRVYLSLLNYVKENGDKVRNDSRGVRFNTTVGEFAKYSGISVRMVNETLRKLDTCGVLQYTIIKPFPSVVILFKQYYEE